MGSDSDAADAATDATVLRAVVGRRNPNIVITGTPGTGKTTHCTALLARAEAAAAAAGDAAAGDADDGDDSRALLAALRHVAVNDVVRERGCHDGWDSEFQSWLVDEERLLDELEPALTHTRGGCVVDWHACDLLPASWVDLVVVLTADTETLYDRLKERNYPEQKLQENMDAEIMQVLLQEAHDAFDAEMVVALPSNTPEQMEENVDRIVAWIRQWHKDREARDKGEEEEEA